MDMDEKEEETRDEYNKSENEGTNPFSIFTELHAVLQAHGYPAKEDIREDHEASTETSLDKPKYALAFENYEDFYQLTLKSLDGFMIIMSTDGVIVYVSENVSSLLDYLPAEVTGKTLLSFVPEEEKEYVHQKINVSLPVTGIEEHIEFCCNFKRGDLDYAGHPAYEFVKCVLNVNDIFHGPFLLYSGHFSAQPTAKDISTLPLEEQFFLMGSVCILRPEMLQECSDLEEVNEEAAAEHIADKEYEFINTRNSESEEESSSIISISTDSSMKTLSSQPESVGKEIEQNEPLDAFISSPSVVLDSEDELLLDRQEQQENDEAQVSSSSMWTHIKVNWEEHENQDDLPSSSTADDTLVQNLSDSPLPSARPMLLNPDAVAQKLSRKRARSSSDARKVKRFRGSSLDVFLEKEDSLENLSGASPQLEQLGEMEQMEQLEQTDQPKQMEQQPEHQKQLEQLEQMEQMEQPKQLEHPEQLEQKQQLKQVEQLGQPEKIEQLDRPEQTEQMEELQQPEQMEQLRKPEQTEQFEQPEQPQQMEQPKQMKQQEKLEQPESIEELEQTEQQKPPEHIEQQGQQEKTEQPNQQEQQEQKSSLQEESLSSLPLQEPMIAESQETQLCLHTHASRLVSFHSNPNELLQPQSSIVPARSVEEVRTELQVPHENWDQRADVDEHHSFLSEESLGSPSDSRSQAESTLSSRTDSSPSTSILETPEDYIQLWQQPPDPQHHIFLQVETWPIRDQIISHQIQAPGALAQPFPGPEVSQSASAAPPDQMTYFVPQEQPDSNQYQKYLRRQQ